MTAVCGSGQRALFLDIKRGRGCYLSSVQVPEGTKYLVQVAGVLQNLFNEGVPFGAQVFLRTVLKREPPEVSG